jgi:hypothetical protein
VLVISGRAGFTGCDLRVQEGTASNQDMIVRGGGAFVSFAGPTYNVTGQLPTLGQIGNTFPFQSDGLSYFFELGPGFPTTVANPRIKGIPWLTAFTVAGLPNPATAAGQVVYCTNGDGGNPCLAVSNGTEWRRISLGAAL